ncbi:10653_t:CDS:2 [Funneliformis caledonium]|uniref:10653_t:CDS:1 n=1 Tax=Funneliformis caledonium TaxID=1117310 RepID=A0A9N8ZBY2_9GLOM|nr:10653_t:CDS:2 [Funneliformis caledonium]
MTRNIMTQHYGEVHIIQEDADNENTDSTLNEKSPVKSESVS